MPSETSREKTGEVSLFIQIKLKALSPFLDINPWCLWIFLTVPTWNLMEPSVLSFTVQPHRALETVVSQWEHMEQRLHCDTAGPQGMKEVILMEWKLMEPRLCCDKPGLDGTKEITVMQWNLKEPRVNCQHIRLS